MASGISGSLIRYSSSTKTTLCLRVSPASCSPWLPFRDNSSIAKANNRYKRDDTPASSLVGRSVLSAVP